MIRRMTQLHTMEININYTILAYADDIIILGDMKLDIIISMANLMEVSKHMGLSINQEKTKYICS